MRRVIFSRLDTAENSQTDEIKATLAFVEHRPPIVKLERAQAKTPTSGELAEKANNKSGQAKPQDSISVDLQ